MPKWLSIREISNPPHWMSHPTQASQAYFARRHPSGVQPESRQRGARSDPTTAQASGCSRDTPAQSRSPIWPSNASTAKRTKAIPSPTSCALERGQCGLNIHQQAATRMRRQAPSNTAVTTVSPSAPFWRLSRGRRSSQHLADRDRARSVRSSSAATRVQARRSAARGRAPVAGPHRPSAPRARSE